MPLLEAGAGATGAWLDCVRRLRLGLTGATEDAVCLGLKSSLMRATADAVQLAHGQPSLWPTVPSGLSLLAISGGGAASRGARRELEQPKLGISDARADAGQP